MVIQKLETGCCTGTSTNVWTLQDQCTWRVTLYLNITPSLLFERLSCQQLVKLFITLYNTSWRTSSPRKQPANFAKKPGAGQPPGARWSAPPAHPRTAGPGAEPAPARPRTGQRSAGRGSGAAPSGPTFTFCSFSHALMNSEIPLKPRLEKKIPFKKEKKKRDIPTFWQMKENIRLRTPFFLSGARALDSV